METWSCQTRDVWGRCDYYATDDLIPVMAARQCRGPLVSVKFYKKRYRKCHETSWGFSRWQKHPEDAPLYECDEKAHLKRVPLPLGAEEIILLQKQIISMRWRSRKREWKVSWKKFWFATSRGRGITKVWYWNTEGSLTLSLYSHSCKSSKFGLNSSRRSVSLHFAHDLRCSLLSRGFQWAAKLCQVERVLVQRVHSLLHLLLGVIVNLAAA